MLNAKKKDIGKNTYEFVLIVPKAQIAKEYERAFDEMIKNLEVEGFRPGKVPKKVAEKHLKKDEVYKTVINKLIPELYKELIGQENFKPIVSPRIQLVKAEEDKDWEIKITVAQKPMIDLKDVISKIKDLKKSLKAEDIWVPGKVEPDKPQKAEDNEKKNQMLNKIFDLILKTAQVEVSDIIVDEEINKRLTQLVDDVRRAGLTVENYLKSKQETLDSIKEKFRREIDEMYKLEFALDQISEDEKIVTDQADLENLFTNIKDEKERVAARNNSYFYAAVLKRQKTLDFLLTL